MGHYAERVGQTSFGPSRAAVRRAVPGYSELDGRALGARLYLIYIETAKLLKAWAAPPSAGGKQQRSTRDLAPWARVFRRVCWFPQLSGE